MTLEVRYCPTCGTRRTGFFRFCGRCGFDFDDLAVTRPSDDPAAPPRPEQPTTPIWPPPVQWPPPDALPTPQVVAGRAVQASTPQTAPSIAAVAAAPSTPAVPVTPAEPPIPAATTAPAPIDWPQPETPPKSRQVPADRPLLARSLAVPDWPTTPAMPAKPATQRVSRGPIVARRPAVTKTRLAIVGLASVLAVSAIAKATSPSSSTEPTPLPTVVLGSPLVGGSPPGVVVPTPAPTLPESTFGPTGQTDAAVVTKIVDGDTIHVDINGIDHALRYIGIDTPEPTSADPNEKKLADSATAANAGLVEGAQVFLEKDVSDTDQFGRLLRYVWFVNDLGDMLMANRELVRRGFARAKAYPPDQKYDDLLIEAEEDARLDGLGVWAPPPDAPPAPTAAPAAQATIQTLVGGGSASKCHPSYTPCLPILDDMNCPEVKALGKAPVRLKGPDDYALDRDHDGLGCE